MSGVNGVRVTSVYFAQQSFSGSDIGGGGFVIDPGRTTYYGGMLPPGAYDAGLVNSGVIINNGGTPAPQTGSYAQAGIIGPGSYELFLDKGPTFEKYGKPTDVGVSIVDISGGLVYFENSGYVFGASGVEGAGAVAVTNSGVLDALTVSGDSGTVLNLGTIQNVSANSGSIDLTNSGFIGGDRRYYGAHVLFTGSVDNQAGGTISALGGNAVTATRLINAGLVLDAATYDDGEPFAVNAAQVTNMQGGTIRAEGTFTAILGQGLPDAMNNPVTTTVVNAGQILAGGVDVMLQDGPGGVALLNNLATGTVASNGSIAVQAFDYAVLKNAGTIVASGALSQVGGFSAGVILGSGGTIINQAGAYIGSQIGSALYLEGTSDPSYAGQQLGTLMNFGTIATSGRGQGGAVVGTSSDTVFNAAGGLILGNNFGLYDAGLRVNVSNAGSIVASGAGMVAGNRFFTPVQAALDVGGATTSASVSNVMTGYIGGLGGVVLSGGSGTVANAGTIASHGTSAASAGAVTFRGVVAGATDVVHNLVGGLIEGTAGIVLGAEHAVATVVNEGSILATDFGVTSAVRAVLAYGAVYAGSLAGASYVTNSGGGYIGGLGGVVLANGGDTVANAGTIANHGTGVVSQAGVVIRGVVSGATDVVHNLVGGLVEGGSGVVIGAKSVVTSVVNEGSIIATDFGWTLVGAPGTEHMALYVGSLAGAAYVSNTGVGYIGGLGGVVLANGGDTVTNAGTITSHGTGLASQAGVIIEGVGAGVADVVRNLVSGVIKSGSGIVIGAEHAIATVINQGSILATGAVLTSGTAPAPQAGVYVGSLAGAAYVANSGGGTIGGLVGIELLGGMDTVVNTGFIDAAALTGAVGGAQAAIYIGSAAGTGYLTNAGGGTIGGLAGVELFNLRDTVVNSGTIQSQGTSGALAAGIYAAGAGALTVVRNAASGVVEGVSGILLGAKDVVGTVVNAGTILATDIGRFARGAQGIRAGVSVGDAARSASVSNAAGGTIGGLVGVDLRGGADTVVNAGSIVAVALAGSGSAPGPQAGVYLGSLAGVAYLSNTAGAYIGGQGGVELFNAGDTVVNAGTISAAGASAVSQAAIYAAGAGGTILLRNLASGVIKGVTGIALDIKGAIGTVLNAGSILAANLGGTGSGATGLAAGVYAGSAAGAVYVLNARSGYIGGLGGVALLNSGDTVINAGTVSSHGTAGASLAAIYLNGAADFVQNLASGVIGGGAGIQLGGVFATVLNAGSIIATSLGGAGGAALSDAAVFLGSGAGGAYVLNAGGGYIGGATGVALLGAAASTLVNRGIVTGSGTSGVAVDIHQGSLVNAGQVAGEVLLNGYLDNAVTGVIFGAVSGAAGALTILNSGTIGAAEGAAGAGAAVAFQSGYANRLEVDPGATFNGGVDGGNVAGSTVTSTIELRSGAGTGATAGRLTGLGTGITDFETVVFDPGADWTVQASPTAVDHTVFDDFAIGDILDVTGFSDMESSFSNDTLSLQDDNGDTVTVDLPGDQGMTAFHIYSDGAGGTDVSIACYREGTLIGVPGGEVAVENLAIGDPVSTAAGQVRSIRWIGKRSYMPRFVAANPRIRPIMFRAGSLGAGLPRRDLFVSAEHAMLLEGMLVPACLLVNGSSIVRDARAGAVVYFHVELETHDVILAEGAASETFIDDDSRGMFHNGAEFAALYPAAAPAAPAAAAAPAARFCAPRVEDGYALEAIRLRLASVADTLVAAKAA